MAIDPRSPPATPARPATVSYERIEAWAVSQAADALAATSLSPSSTSPAAVRRGEPRGMSVTIDIPLDEPPPVADPKPARPEAVHTVYQRRTPVRRDSLVRREALLKGKEGSRRRQRWENDHLVGNPWANEPPLPIDWAVRPTHPVHRVPYAIAPLWDAGYATAAAERARQAQKARARNADGSAANLTREAARVAQELRAKLKKARGAKGLLQDLEEAVRSFVREWEDKQRQLEDEGAIAESSDDDDEEEIVFVGRSGASHDAVDRHADAALAKDKLIFESLVDDHGAAFGRYLVHAIGTYYGLKTWSVTTTGSPARREAYVSLDVDGPTQRPPLSAADMPRPLWAVI
ncbi:uncharacterized protein K489DRAFT_316914 [Dissoconium aciculare CBS 342.82]|uniref:R3H-associated N-terminal domain-containing protein n=1 Tax=Dissoconium aciculare CBS 342.82 TaxID=1314786 RepID=A0A6J3M9V9_9PEZI|nr:uncharacterized protein K489DRAFT_316914 [Dissoconium aciculare CBS 342.82]KAF1824409.1 hypothetical protein K489DRAFT_316914 [Dissoconium aciculare CBS 342.82]